jgi:hypothetical protein
MRHTFVAVLFAIAASACGGADPIADCKALVELACNKTFECSPTGAEVLYGTVSNCIATASAQSCTAARTACPSGYSFNSGNSKRCIDDYRSASCSDVGAGVLPESCNQVCTR